MRVSAALRAASDAGRPETLSSSVDHLIRTVRSPRTASETMDLLVQTVVERTLRIPLIVIAEIAPS